MKKYFPVLQFINLPNSFTTLGLVFGVIACYFINEGNLRGILICLSLASLMDLLDGFFAEKLNQQTTFGQQADSLVDFFICCIIPILVVYTFVGSGFWLMSGLVFYCICGLWRLAYYNVVAAEKRTYFTGLPVPGALLLVTMVIWVVVNYDFPVWFLTGSLYFAGLLMVSFFKLVKYGIWQKVLWVIGLFFLTVVVLS